MINFRLFLSGKFLILRFLFRGAVFIRNNLLVYQLIIWGVSCDFRLVLAFKQLLRFSTLFQVGFLYLLHRSLATLHLIILRKVRFYIFLILLRSFLAFYINFMILVNNALTLISRRQTLNCKGAYPSKLIKTLVILVFQFLLNNLATRARKIC